MQLRNRRGQTPKDMIPQEMAGVLMNFANDIEYDYVILKENLLRSTVEPLVTVTFGPKTTGRSRRMLLYRDANV